MGWIRKTIKPQMVAEGLLWCRNSVAAVAEIHQISRDGVATGVFPEKMFFDKLHHDDRAVTAEHLQPRQATGDGR